MGDEDLGATSKEEEDSGEPSEEELEHKSLSESVEGMKKKTLTSMKKWNDEVFLYALDRQLISSGIRLLLFLPAFAILAFFGAWSQATTSPDWWDDFVEPTIGQSFATILVLLVFVILLGYILSMAVHRHRVNLSIMNFRNKVKEAEELHLSVRSLHGYDPLEKLLNKSASKHFFALIYSMLAILSISAILFYGIQTDTGRNYLLLSFSFTVLSLGQHIYTRSSHFNMAKRTGLLNSYQPPVHPSTLDMVLSDLVKSQLDPLLKTDYDAFVKDVEKHVKRGIEPRFAREKMMMILYKHSKGLDLSSVFDEFGEILNKNGVKFVKEHPVFTIEQWLTIIEHIETRTPAFFRMIGRIEEDLSAGRDTLRDGIVFEVDMENIVHKKANLFTFMHNLSNESRTLVLRVQSPDFRPHDLAMTYRLEPGEEKWWPDEPVPIAQKGNDDILAVMSGLLRDGTVAWQTMLPERYGEATVSVRLEEVSGELLIGSQMNVRIRPEFKERIRSISSLVLSLIGVTGIVAASVIAIFNFV
jgi:hypothetical protein